MYSLCIISVSLPLSSSPAPYLFLPSPSTSSFGFSIHRWWGDDSVEFGPLLRLECVRIWVCYIWIQRLQMLLKQCILLSVHYEGRKVLMNKLMCCCSEWILFFLLCLKTKEMLRAAITARLSIIQSTLHSSAPAGYVGCHPYITHTHTCACPAYTRVLPCGLQWPTATHFDQLSRHPAPPSGVTGHPWSCVVATCIRLWGRPGHALASLLREENLLHAGGGRTGYEVRRCESKKEKKKCDWQNVGEDRCRWDKWQQVGDRNRKTGDVDGEKKMMSKWEEESEKEQHLAFERNIVVISFVLVTTACSGGGCFPP